MIACCHAEDVGDFAPQISAHHFGRERRINVPRGVALGLVILFPLGRVLANLTLFRVSVDRLTDGVLAPSVLAMTTLAVVAGAGLTAVVSAARAARIDPAEALRAE